MTPRRIIVTSAPSTAAAEARAAAALVAALRRGGLDARSMRPAGPGDTAMPAGSREFATAGGVPQPNGVHWLERAEGTPWEHDRPLPDSGPVVIALPTGLPVPSADLVVAAETLPVALDAFGRPFLIAPVAGLPEAVPLAVPDPAPGPRIGIIGHARHLREVNPTIIARLADTAEALGIGLEIAILPAATVAQVGLPEDLHGLVLPGGSDMLQVEPQIRAAQQAHDRDLPLLGLCLGMQSMVMAGLRRAGWPDAVLEEIDGPGPRRGFVMMRDAEGAPLQRRGDAVLTPAPGSALAGLLGGPARVRMHHRFRLAPEAAPLLAEAGITVTALDPSGVPDAVEIPERRFQMGLQGHPEIGVCPALPGLWQGFLRAAQSFRKEHSA